MTHPQLLNDMTTARRADFGREMARRSGTGGDATPRAPRARAMVVAGLLVRIATRIDPSVVPAMRKTQTPAFNA